MTENLSFEMVAGELGELDVYDPMTYEFTQVPDDGKGLGDLFISIGNWIKKKTSG